MAVTTVIPTIGRETLWTRAIPSLMAQTVEDWRCIIVGDGVHIPPFADPRITVMRIDAPEYPDDPLLRWRIGGVRAFAHGLDHVQTTWWSYLADDDEYMPVHDEYLERAGGDADVVYGMSESMGRSNIYGAEWPPRADDICQGGYIMRTALGMRPVEDTTRAWDTTWWHDVLGQPDIRFARIQHLVHRTYIADAVFDYPGRSG